MLISELIFKLEELKAKDGDLPVYLDQQQDKGYSFFPVRLAYKIHLFKEWLDNKDGQPEDLGYVIVLKK